MRKIVVIPARLHSSRLPKKVLLDLGGKSIIEHVFIQGSKAEEIDAVYIATDSQEIAKQCQQFADNIIMTSAKHQSGTDRIAEAIENIDCDIVVNVQGDEPFIDPELISTIANALEQPDIYMSSAMQKIDSIKDLNNPNIVKVVVNSNKQAMYFSRSTIPYCRDNAGFPSNSSTEIPDNLSFYRHVGIYGYQKKFLLRYSQMQSSYLENVEKLEQLRALENGYTIQMIETDHDAFGIDTEDDYKEALKRINNEHQ